MMPARMVGGIQSEANKRGIVSNLNEPKTNHNTINKPIAITAKTTPTALALVRLRRFTGDGGFVILSPNHSFSIISKVSDQYSVEVGREVLSTKKQIALQAASYKSE